MTTSTQLPGFLRGWWLPALVCLLCWQPAQAQSQSLPDTVVITPPSWLVVPRLEYLGKFPVVYLATMRDLPRLNGAIGKGYDPQPYIDKSEALLNLIEGYYDDAQYPFLFYYFQPTIDSLKDEVLRSSGRALSLSRNLPKGRVRALQQLGQVYEGDGDSVYSHRVRLALDSAGYKFPHYAHGLFLGAGLGNAVFGHAGYFIGYKYPWNGKMGMTARHNGLVLGGEANPLRGIGGFSVGLLLGLPYVQTGIHLSIMRSTRIDDPNNPGRQSEVTTLGVIRPEIGFNRDWFQVFGGYNILYRGSKAPRGDYNYFRNAYPSLFVGVRFMLTRPLGKDAFEYMEGFRRRY